MNALKLNKLDGFKLPTAILGVAVTGDAKVAYAACMDGVYEASVEDGSHDRISQHDSYVSSVALRDEFDQVISAGYDGNLQWFDLSKRQTVRTVDAHRFWSWRMALSPSGDLVATVTGQYLAGDYEYQPAAEKEPSVRVFDADTGELLKSFSHVPSVQCVAFSPDSRYLAAANIMGEVRVWDLDLVENSQKRNEGTHGEATSSAPVQQWTTPDFTSWGIIKSHCHIGGVFDIKFTPSGDEILITGMGPMRDPMAGNGKQTWQRFAWQEEVPKKTGEFKGGEGLMETLAVHPAGTHFVMGGRLRGGSWNAAIFEMATGKLVDQVKTGYRITNAQFSGDGELLFLAGTQGQPKPKDGKFKSFGRFDIYQL